MLDLFAKTIKVFIISIVLDLFGIFFICYMITKNLIWSLLITILANVYINVKGYIINKYIF